MSSIGFAAGSRFRIERRIGSGGFGDVYEAYDFERAGRIALKVLRQITPESLYQFKQEFRRLTDLVHPNLVRLHELQCAADHWFFTMELVHGRPLTDFLRAHRTDAPVNSAVSADDPADITSLGTVDNLTPGATPVVPPQNRGTFTIDRNVLRSVFAQLIEGVDTLHQRGLLHRDLKPSNVLVTPEGRVVILDFGLVTDAITPGAAKTQHLGGTPMYMAPEQGNSTDLTTAADWYAVGVMLYEVLTDRLPFTGNRMDVLVQKMNETPPSVRTWVDGVPYEMTALCDDLLRPAPLERPSVQAIRRLFGAPAPPASAKTTMSLSGLVDRSEHLASLDAAFAAIGGAQPVIVHVHGRSGIGKTALVRHFLSTLQQQRDDVVVLAGRCYEQESVRYKGLDSLIDALSRHLRGLPSTAVDAVLPRDVAALARVFPVLDRVEMIANAPRRSSEVSDPQELRRRAAAALRELLARLSDRARVVLYVDDLQWGDADSAAFMQEVLRPPDAPPLLMIASYRREEQPRNEALRVLMSVRGSAGLDVRELPVDEMSLNGAAALAERLLPPALIGAAAAIAREASGSPLFVRELVDYVNLDPEAVNRGLSLSDVIRTRAAHLPPLVRHALEVIAVAGQPIDGELMRRAAGPELTYEAIERLRRENFIKDTRVGERAMIEASHDRIREAVLDWLEPPQRAELHVRLAQELERSGSVDPELLALHFRAGGDRLKATHYAVEAAESASRALAFERAVNLYKQALEFSDLHVPQVAQLRTRLADALANSGRGADSGDAYLAAAALSDGYSSIELKRRAAEQFLRSGRVDDGMSALSEVLAAVNMRLPRSSSTALLGFLARRARLRLRGLRYVERPASEVSANELLRVDVCWTAAVGLTMVDTIRAIDFQARHLLLALRAGEPERLARAMAMEVGHSAIPGSTATRRANQVLELASALAARTGRPEPIARVEMLAACAAWARGEWLTSYERAMAADRMLREQCSGVAWELGTGQVFATTALGWMGRLVELGEVLPRLTREARARGDLYAESAFTLLVPAQLIQFAQDAPDVAEEQFDHYLKEWTTRGFHQQHFWALYGRTEVDLYRDDPARAWDRMNAQWPLARRAMLLRPMTSRVSMLYARGRCATAFGAINRGAARQALVSKATQDARALRQTGEPWAQPLAFLIEASLCELSGDVERAVMLLERAEQGLAQHHMQLYAAAARARRGKLVGGEVGAFLARDGEGWMLNQGVVSPTKMTRVLIPGL